MIAPFAYALLAGALLLYAWHARPRGPGRWRRVRGTVRAAAIEEGLVLAHGVSTHGHHVVVRCRYVVDGEQFEAIATAARVMTRTAAEDIASARYRPGAPVNVWHDPDEPARVALASPTTPASIFCAVVGLLALACSIATALDRGGPQS